jgi:hypothetical protein
MSDDGNVAAVGGEKDTFLTINGMKIARRENQQWTSLRLQGEGLRRHGWNIGRARSIPIDATRPWIAFYG